jgi:CBS domain-containing protein
MKLRFLLTLLCSVAAELPAPAGAQTAEERRQLDWALERGRLLFALDRAAWVATDDMMERIGDPQGAGVRGYVVDRDASGLVAIFYARDGERYVTAYRARIGSRGVQDPQVFAGAARPELTPGQSRLARALEWVRSNMQGFPGCIRQPFNVAIVPPATADGPIDVYVMTPQVDDKSVPLGGHYRVTLNSAGQEVSRRSFARTCLMVPLRIEGPATVGGLMVSHLLDPVPTEVHVFSSMAVNIPIFVIIPEPRSLWQVSGTQIELMEAGPQQGRR